MASSTMPHKLHKGGGSDLLIYFLMYFPLFEGVLCLSLFCCALLFVHFSMHHLDEKEKSVSLMLFSSYRSITTTHVIWLFLTVPWVGLQCATVVFPDHTHLLFIIYSF